MNCSGQSYIWLYVLKGVRYGRIWGAFKRNNIYSPSDRVGKAMLPIKRKVRQFHAASIAERVAEASIGAFEIGVPKDLARVLAFGSASCYTRTYTFPLLAGISVDFSDNPMEMPERILSTADVAPRNPITIRWELGERTRS